MLNGCTVYVLVGYKLCQTLRIVFLNTKRTFKSVYLRILVNSLKRNVFFFYLNGEEAFNAILCVQMYRKCSM
jgi:hypothetical protein